MRPGKRYASSAGRPSPVVALVTRTGTPFAASSMARRFASTSAQMSAFVRSDDRVRPALPGEHQGALHAPRVEVAVEPRGQEHGVDVRGHHLLPGPRSPGPCARSSSCAATPRGSWPAPRRAAAPPPRNPRSPGSPAGRGPRGGGGRRPRPCARPPGSGGDRDACRSWPRAPGSIRPPRGDESGLQTTASNRSLRASMRTLRKHTTPGDSRGAREGRPQTEAATRTAEGDFSGGSMGTRRPVPARRVPRARAPASERIGLRPA